MTCKNCGKEIKEGIMFCPECGNKIENDISTNINPQQNINPQYQSNNNVWFYFTDVIKKFWNLVTTGRCRRAEFWGFNLFYFVAIFIGILIDSFIFFGFGNVTDYISYILFLPAWYVTIRRMHDVGKSGWFSIIPIYGLILCFFDSEKGTNKYGPNPKGV